MTKEICPSCGHERQPAQMRAGDLVPDVVAETVQAAHPHWSPSRPVCSVCLREGQARYVENLLEAEMGGMGEDEMGVVASIRDDRLLARDEYEAGGESWTRGEQIAAAVAGVVGSWFFPAGIALFLFLWLGWNLFVHGVEPYPMIALAVVSAALATLAALHGPFIVMNQRHQQKRDRARAANDYRVNLKAELEIRFLAGQMDKLLQKQAELHQQFRRLERESASTGENRVESK